MAIPRGTGACFPAVLAAIALSALRVAASVTVDGPLAYDYVVQIGKAYQGALGIKNDSSESASVGIRQIDYLFYADGRILYEEAGSHLRSNARWITVSPTELVLRAGESATIRYTVSVPDDSSLVGSYWSALMVEPASNMDAATLGAGSSVSIEVRQIVRYAVQIATQVGETGVLDLRFSRIHVTAGQAGPRLEVDAENTGDRWYRATLWAELYDADGISVGRFEGGVRRMYPGTSARFQSQLAGVHKGGYTALIVADCGGDDVYGVTVDLVFQ